jgi:hypothetical protein
VYPLEQLICYFAENSIVIYDQHPVIKLCRHVPAPGQEMSNLAQKDSRRHFDAADYLFVVVTNVKLQMIKG